MLPNNKKYMTKFEKFVLYLPVIGLILKATNIYYYKTSVTWDYYQIAATTYLISDLCLRYFGYNLFF